MTYKDLVEKVLTEVAEGAKAAQSAVEEAGGAINPNGSPQEVAFEFDISGSEKVSFVVPLRFPTTQLQKSGSTAVSNKGFLAQRLEKGE